jgi:membrane associated rhomboid family serine protease
MGNNWNTYQSSNYSFGMQRLMPTGVKYLLIANGAVFLLQFIFKTQLVALFGLTPVAVLHQGAIYQLVTYMFLHGGFFHILMNMFILWMFGPELELTWGIKQFFFYYFLTGIAGGAFTVAFQPHSVIPTIGASGAIYGLLVAYAVMWPNRTLMLYFLIPMKVKYAVILFVGLEFFASVMGNTDGIGHLAHLGGAAIGFLYLKSDWRLHTLWRWISPARIWGRWQYRHKSHRVEKNRQQAEEIMRRVDQILDKINEVGLENISEEERRFLDDASEILSKKDK